MRSHSPRRRCGYAIATVHDSLGCLPSRAERFGSIIREQFVRMYVELSELRSYPAAFKNPE